MNAREKFLKAKKENPALTQEEFVASGLATSDHYVRMTPEFCLATYREDGEDEGEEEEEEDETEE